MLLKIPELDMNLVIVESPTKAKTIEKFLGKDYLVTSSYGHVRDLPKGKLGVDVEKEFEPHYIIPRRVQKRVTALKKEAAKAETVILATDEDREGEAIAWHLSQALKVEPENVRRIVFHEITEDAISGAIKAPRDIDRNLVDAQQARRIIDRLVGYKLSPFLWKKIRGGLSAGRVQSVAVKLIVDREDEINKFKPKEYWSVIAELATEAGNSFEASVSNINGDELGKLDIKNEKQARKIVEDIKESKLTVGSVTKKETKRNPLPPFTTSTLQQTASGRLSFSAKQTMLLAQRLYENGYITYMRTDSLNLSRESTAAAKKWITEKLGKEYAVSAPRSFKAKSKLAQEAHEAIRPTNLTSLPLILKSVTGRKKCMS
jgi:DNA topoisomerase I